MYLSWDLTNSTVELDLFCATILYCEWEGLWHKADVRFFFKCLFVPEGEKTSHWEICLGCRWEMYNSVEKTPFWNRHTLVHIHTNTPPRFPSVTTLPLLPHLKQKNNSLKSTSVNSNSVLNCFCSCHGKNAALHLSYCHIFLNICLLTEFGPQQEFLQNHW